MDVERLREIRRDDYQIHLQEGQPVELILFDLESRRVELLDLLDEIADVTNCLLVNSELAPIAKMIRESRKGVSDE